MIGFGERLSHALGAYGPLCVGIDPHAGLLHEWGLDLDADGAEEFGLRVVAAARGSVGIVKPQVSFFERFGTAGFAALERVLAAAREADLIVIADAKRGDIGSTMDAYARAWLTPGAPLEADALTVNPYLGVGALQQTFAFAQSQGKGAFVLAATSNPEGSTLQSARGEDRVVSRLVAAEVAAYNDTHRSGAMLADIGLVVGATLDSDDERMPDPGDPPTPILAPGFGHQGAEPHELPLRFGALSPAVIATESRSVLSAGPTGIADRIAQRAELYRKALHG